MHQRILVLQKMKILLHMCSIWPHTALHSLDWNYIFLKRSKYVDECFFRVVFAQKDAKVGQKSSVPSSFSLSPARLFASQRAVIARWGFAGVQCRDVRGRRRRKVGIGIEESKEGAILRKIPARTCRTRKPIAKAVELSFHSSPFTTFFARGRKKLFKIRFQSSRKVLHLNEMTLHLERINKAFTPPQTNVRNSGISG